jgi:hypothetical protein
MATDAQIELFRALRAHTAELEIERDSASGHVLEALDRRVEAARLLLDWVSKALGPGPAGFPTQTPSPSEPQAEPGQSSRPQSGGS